MKRIYGMAMLASLFALAAAAQDLAAQDMTKQLNETINNLKLTVIRTEGGVTSNVKNAPYRADQISETTQILGDGTRIHNEHQVTLYRDSQGRTRRETPDEVSIMDPTAGVGYILHPKEMTYRKMTVSVSVSSGTTGERRIATVRTGAFLFPGGGDDMPLALAQTLPDGPGHDVITLSSRTVTASAAKKESLGTQNMEGVNAQGERRTSTIETGEIGNDRPIQIISERWYSPDLQVDVMTRHSDPRTGEEITRLTNINRAEPDASLFTAPVGYQLIEGPAVKGGRGGRGGGQ